VDRKVGFVARRLTYWTRLHSDASEDCDGRARRLDIVCGGVLAPRSWEDCAAAPGGAAGGAEVIEDVIAPSMAVARARKSLARARVELDSAVGSLSTGVNEKVMASSEVLALLIRVVDARRHLESLEGGSGAAEAGRRT
jgi:hypothetical protein